MRDFRLILCISLLAGCCYAMGIKPQRVSVITGASGYVGRAVAHALLEEKNVEQKILCLVRPTRVESENDYWEDHKAACIEVFPYDMLDGGKSVQAALEAAMTTDEKQQPSDSSSLCVYHVASWFSPSEKHVQMAKDNVKGTEDLVRVLGKFPGCRLVVTSSMAAVRATNQEPSNGKFYTATDWNTVSKLGDNWGASYQWSKAESERRAWAIAKELNINMVSLCPSFVFGPPASTELSSNSFSTELVGQWIKGESTVQSRLFVDIRDVAQAHVAAGTLLHAVGKRYIVSTEKRLKSEAVATVLKKMCTEANFGNPDKITHDAVFTGGSIPIGEKEVEAEERLLKDLDVSLRPAETTIADMAEFLIQSFKKDATKAT